MYCFSHIYFKICNDFTLHNSEKSYCMMGYDFVILLFLSNVHKCGTPIIPLGIFCILKCHTFIDFVIYNRSSSLREINKTIIFIR